MARVTETRWQALRRWVEDQARGPDSQDHGAVLDRMDALERVDTPDDSTT